MLDVSGPLFYEWWNPQERKDESLGVTTLLNMIWPNGEGDDDDDPSIEEESTEG